ncbi:MAG TPA: substrate-binding domain-containing protein, partial [Nitrolancea sp.]|nr:substrate-binding domain-containing protein [Nitrolancea sp.]
ATEQAVAYLYNLGHRQIAHLPGLLHTTVGRDRTNAYCDAMLQRGLAPWVLAAGWTIEEGMAVTETLLSARKLPTAILASSDHTAIGAMHVLRRAGLRVPDDLSVLGFANLPGSELVDPPLTTMGYDREQMGQLMITALFSLVRGEPAPGKIVVPAQFLVRRSCAPPAVAGEERILLRTAPEDGGTSHGHA